ncbi:hypothetical protein ACWC9R_20715 [Streptomyces sp. NPDC001219]
MANAVRLTNTVRMAKAVRLTTALRPTTPVRLLPMNAIACHTAYRGTPNRLRLPPSYAL